MFGTPDLFLNVRFQLTKDARWHGVHVDFHLRCIPIQVFEYFRTLQLTCCNDMAKLHSIQQEYIGSKLGFAFERNLAFGGRGTFWRLTSTLRFGIANCRNEESMSERLVTTLVGSFMRFIRMPLYIHTFGFNLFVSIFKFS